MVNRAGAKLLSVKEPIGENTSHGIMLEGVMAAVAAARRIEISEEVKRGVKRKIEVGGTHGRAPIGYLNIREPLPQGGEVRTIAIDPERAPIIIWAFETYATGLYSISDMTILLEARGLRSRGNRRRAPQSAEPLEGPRAALNPYYVGYVTHNGRIYEGRHEPLISQELSTRSRRSSRRTGTPGSATAGTSTTSRARSAAAPAAAAWSTPATRATAASTNTSSARATSAANARRATSPSTSWKPPMEDHYAAVSFSDAEREEVRQAITDDLGEQVATAQAGDRRLPRRPETVKEEERKLLNMHYQDRISGELFDDEQTRIRQRRQDAEALIARLSVNYDDVTATLDLALEILGEDLHDLYRRGDDTIRRLINQAIFNALFVCDETISQAQLAEPFAELRALHDAIRGIAQHDAEPIPRAAAAARLPRRRREAPTPAGAGNLFVLVRLATFWCG